MKKINCAQRCCQLITLLFLLLFFLSGNSFAETPPRASLEGRVTTTSGEPVSFATIYLVNTNFACYSNDDGSFKMTAPQGNYQLHVSMMGYRTTEQNIELTAGKKTELSIKLEKNDIELGDVEVVGQSVVQQINNTAYNVSAIDVKKLHNNSLSVAQVLDRISGVKIKQAGGVGSSNQITLNGFSGRHVRVFMDGIPLDGAGSSMQLGKIPLNMADRIEVYKGVVPVELGSDALGGAINIVSRQGSGTFLDASYSYGSFNTHSSNLTFGQTAKSGLTYQVSVYQNYSDNDYRVKTRLLDLSTNTYSSDEQWFRRFHDTYHNEAVVARVGVRNKSWADRLMLETTLSQEEADIQNANLMQIVYGGKKREAKSVIPAVYYSKKDLLIEGFDLSASAKYNRVRNNNIDTLARQYNWLGEYRIKSSVGESEYSLAEFRNNTLYIVGTANYQIGERQHLSLNHVYSSFGRRTTDAAANQNNSTPATFMKRSNTKNTTGLSYRLQATDQWTLLGFGKYYAVHVSGPVNISSSTTREEYEYQERDFNSAGYGLASTYQLTPAWQLKASFEKSYRLPTANELFGDQILETGDMTLKAENSNNVNLNVNFNKTFHSSHTLNVETGLIYRNTRDYIRRRIEQRYGGAFYENHGRVLTWGADLNVRYLYKKRLVIGTNVTYQDIRNKERYSSTGQTLIYYDDRMPNVPYLFSNTDASYNWRDLFAKNDFLSVGYTMQYVHDFFRNWESEGGDIIIPEQLSHDITVNYSLKNGRYNVAFEARNVTDEMLYDNYSLQKPGRAFFIKLRYQFSK